MAEEPGPQTSDETTEPGTQDQPGQAPDEEQRPATSDEATGTAESGTQGRQGQPVNEGHISQQLRSEELRRRTMAAMGTEPVARFVDPNSEEAKQILARLQGPPGEDIADQNQDDEDSAAQGQEKAKGQTDEDSTGKSQQSANDGRNLWDFLSVAVVVTALVVLVIYLLDRSNLKPSDIESILGIVVPVFAAVFGATVGAAAGHVTGKSAGKKATKAYLSPKITSLQAARSQAAGRIRVARPPLGEGVVGFQGPLRRARTAQDTDIDTTLGEMKGYLDSL